MSASVNDKAPKGMRVSDVRIRRVENGHIGSVGFEPDPDAAKDGDKKKGEGMCCPYVPDKQYVLGDHAAIHEFIDKALGMKPAAKAKPRRFGNSY